VGRRQPHCGCVVFGVSVGFVTRFGFGAGNPVQFTDPLGLAVWDDWGWDWAPVSDFAYGMVDGLTMGGVSWLVDSMGWDSRFLDSCSSALEWGGYTEMAAELIVGAVVTLGAGVPALLAKDGVTREWDQTDQALGIEPTVGGRLSPRSAP
jgi:hypothetical protein